MYEPIPTLLYLGAAGYLGYLFFRDYESHQKGNAHPNALPGATPASRSLILAGALGGVLLVLLETAGEYGLGISGRQSTIPVWAILPLLAAALLEEIIFRGYLVVTTKGRGWLYGSILLFSALFALVHFHWLTKVEGEGAILFGYALSLTKEAVWWTLLLFLNSVWFYALRFVPQNRQRSLLPCIVAHAAGNLSVYLVKFFQGYVQAL